MSEKPAGVTLQDAKAHLFISDVVTDFDHEITQFLSKCDPDNGREYNLLRLSKWFDLSCV